MPGQLTVTRSSRTLASQFTRAVVRKRKRRMSERNEKKWKEGGNDEERERDLIVTN